MQAASPIRGDRGEFAVHGNERFEHFLAREKTATPDNLLDLRGTAKPFGIQPLGFAVMFFKRLRGFSPLVS